MKALQVVCVLCTLYILGSWLYVVYNLGIAVYPDSDHSSDGFSFPILIGIVALALAGSAAILIVARMTYRKLGE